MKVVLDTNVLISSTLWDGSVAQKLLFILINKDIEIFSSKEILNEYQKVLKRDFDYGDNEIELIMNKLLAFVKIIEPKEKVDIIKDDKDDNKIIECAIASSSSCIITYDKHLLSLKEYRQIRIITPEQGLKIF